MRHRYHDHDRCCHGLDWSCRFPLCMIAYIKKKLPAKKVFVKELKVLGVIFMITAGISLSEKFLPVYLSWMGVSTCIALGFVVWNRVQFPSKKVTRIDDERVAKDPELVMALKVLFSRMDKKGELQPQIPDPTCPYEKIRQKIPPSHCWN